MGKRNFGTIRQLQAGRYQVRYRSPAGILVPAPHLFVTKAEAARWLSMTEAAMLRGDYRDPALGRTTFGHWAERWFATTSTLKTKTRLSYRGVLDNHLLPAFGQDAIGGIDTPAVRTYLTEQIACGKPKGTVSKFRAVFGLVMKTAVDGGAIRANPVLGIRLGTTAKQEKVFLTPDQIADLAHAIAHPPRGKRQPERTYPMLGLLVQFAAYTGLRAGELAALRVRRLDLMRKSVEVAESLAEVPGGLEFGPTKNYQRRSVPVPLFLVPALADLIAGRSPDDLVFTSPTGKPLRQTNLDDRFFRPAVGRAGLPAATTFHDLRHTYAALLISQNANPLSVMRRMGHSSIQVTFGVYGHIFPHLEEELTDRLDTVGRNASRTPDASVAMLPSATTQPKRARRQATRGRR